MAFKIKDLWASDGKVKCLDCGEFISKGFEYWNVFEDGIKVGCVHSPNGCCSGQVVGEGDGEKERQ